MKRLVADSLTRTCRRYRYYKEREAPEFVLQLASVENRHFGMAMEYVVRDALCLEKSYTSMYDAMWNDKRMEIKSSRIYLPQEDYVWTRLKPHKFDIALLVALDPSGLFIYRIDSRDYQRLGVSSLSLNHHRDYLTSFKYITQLK